MVVFDASILLFVFDENTPSSVPRARERVEHLIDRLTEAGEKIIIPTPALSECLVHAGPAGPEYLTILGKQSCFRVASFDGHRQLGCRLACEIELCRVGG